MDCTPVEDLSERSRPTPKRRRFGRDSRPRCVFSGCRLLVVEDGEGGDAVGACTHVVVATTLEDAWRMDQGTTTVISGPQRSILIGGVTSTNGVTSIA